MVMDTALEILKWVLLILLAGFIGQFGKSLSLAILHYFKKGKGQEIPTVSQEIKSSPSSSPEPSPKETAHGEFTTSASENARAKIEKKRLKADVKAKKKSGQ